jgi:hypothetical protein
MAQRTRTLSIVHERMLGDDLSGGPDFGQDTGGQEWIVGVTDIGVYLYRMTVRVGWDWSDGVVQIVKAELRMQERSTVLWGSSPRFLVRRLTAAPGQNEVFVAADPNTTVAGQVDTGVIASPADGKWLTLDITALAEAFAPSYVQKRSGAGGDANANYGLRLRAFVETNDAAGNNGQSTFWSGMTAPAARRAHVILTYLDNHQPNAPIVNSPEMSGSSPAIVGSYTGTELPIDFLFSDSDKSDVLSNVKVEMHGDGATDTSPALLVTKVGGQYQLPGLHHWGVKPNFTTLQPRVNRRFRLQTTDNRGSTDSAGKWTSLADGRVFLAYKSRKPVNVVMTTNPDGPVISATINSADPGDFITAAEPEVWRDTPTGKQSLFAPGMDTVGGSPTRVSIAYSGTALAIGDKVSMRIRVNGRDGVTGDWSDTVTVTMRAQTGPATMTPADTSTKLTSRTQQFTIGDVAAFDGIQYRYYRDDELIHDSGLIAVSSGTTTNFNAPTVNGVPVLQWGDGVTNTTEWEAAVRPTGTLSLNPFSPRHGIRVNSLPSTTVTVSA